MSKKITEIDGAKYSREPFDDYAWRAIVEMKTADGLFSTQIYTSEKAKNKVFNAILNAKSKKVKSVYIIHWATKEQDDLNAKFIDEWLEKF